MTAAESTAARLGLMDPAFCLPTLIAANAARDPDAVWAQQVAGGSLSYGRAHSDGLRWAASIEHLGVRRGDNVIAMMPPTVDLCLLWVALADIGAVLTPMNTDFDGAVFAHIVTTSQARVFVTLERYLPVLARSRDAVAGLAAVVVLDSDEPQWPEALASLESLARLGRAQFEALGAGNSPTLAQLRPWDVSCMPFTSGTTGPSKGVLITWTQLYYNALRVHPLPEISREDVFYSPLPLYHLGGLSAVFAMAVPGGRVVLRERFSGSEFWSDVRRFGCTATCLIGGMPAFVYRQPERPDDADNPLRAAVISPVMPEFEDFKRRFGIERLSTGFSQTELAAPIWADEVDDHESCGVLKPGPPYYEVRLVDDDDREVPVGTTGELVVRSGEPWAFASGYFAAPEATAESLRNAWFHTGDMLRVDAEGRYYFIDRKKDALRRRGEFISSYEVECQLLEHPAVKEAGVIGVPSEWGEQDIKAVVVLVEGAALTAPELVEFLTPRLARFMVPRYIEFVAALPRTDTQKLMKHELRRAGVTPGTWDREKHAPERPDRLTTLALGTAADGRKR